MYFNARFYDAEIGRFISLDPIKDGLNWYTYCNNNPLRYVDKNGLAPYETSALNYAQQQTINWSQVASFVSGLAKGVGGVISGVTSVVCFVFKS